MALFDIFKNKKKPEKKVAPKKAGAKIQKEIKPEPVKESATVPLKSKKDSEVACRILKWPHVTEKATDLTKVGQYIFNVYEKANKPEIKKAVEDVYGVKVVSVKIIKIHPKKRRLGRVEGFRKGYKKAIVRLAQDQQIEILPR